LVLTNDDKKKYNDKIYIPTGKINGKFLGIHVLKVFINHHRLFLANVDNHLCTLNKNTNIILSHDNLAEFLELFIKFIERDDINFFKTCPKCFIKKDVNEFDISDCKTCASLPHK
jgi:hypothetical protein